MKRTYIAFLRGINVGGHTVAMDRLRSLFVEMDLANVRTYIQSGNVFFVSEDADREGLARRIEKQLARALGFEVAVFLRTLEEVSQTLALSPFDGVDVDENTRLYVAFLPKPLPDAAALPHVSPKGDFEILAATDGEAFMVIHQEPGPARQPRGLSRKNLRGSEPR